MKNRGDEIMRLTLETTGRYEIMEMHLFDNNARKEDPHCGAVTSGDDLRGAIGYLEDRLHDVPVGTVCEECKPLAVSFAQELAQDLAAEGLPDEVERYCILAGTLFRETGQEPGRD